MKKIIKSKLWYLILGIFFGITSCNDVFDVERTGVLTADNLWNNSKLVKNYVDGFYNILPTGLNLNLLSDESTQWGYNGILDGTLENADYPVQIWDYGTIRNINNFILNIPNIKGGLSQEEINYLNGQAHFFRAYQYYKMVRVLGGVPIIKTIQDPTDNIEKLKVKRNTTLECFDYIVADLDTAIEKMVKRSSSLYETGRVTKEAAMAVKAEVLLLKASPLFCSSPDTKYWQDAYNAALKAKSELDADGYGLYENAKQPQRSLELMWYDKENALKEYVLYIPYKRDVKNSGIPGGTGVGFIGLTWDAVKSFPMANGKNIEDIGSGYSEHYFMRNRDPRFYATVVWNGAIFGQSMDGEAVLPNRRHFMYTELGGEIGWKFNNPYGLIACKRIDTTLVKRTRGAEQAFDWPIIRYAEVLLNLAECANHLDGHRNEVVDLIKQIRQRSRVQPGGDLRYGLSKDVGVDEKTTFDAIVKERQVELMLEDKRFWDLRRWRKFDILNNMIEPHAYGPVLNKAALQKALGTTEENVPTLVAKLQSYLSAPPSGLDIEDYIYQFTSYSTDADNVKTFNIKDNYYFGSISRNEIQINSNLEQNKGWDNGTFNPMIK